MGISSIAGFRLRRPSIRGAVTARTLCLRALAIATALAHGSEHPVIFRRLAAPSKLAAW